MPNNKQETVMQTSALRTNDVKAGWVCTLMLALLLGGCGGGGGSSGDLGNNSTGAPLNLNTGGPLNLNIGAPLNLNTGNLQLPGTSQTPGMSQLSGTVRFQRVPSESAGLSYASIQTAAARGVVVQVLDSTSSTVLASGTTDDAGQFSLSLPMGRTVVLRAKATLEKAGPGSSWNVSVKDNTRNDGLYVLDSVPFTVNSVQMTRDLLAESGWNGQSYNTTRAAAPFAALDTVYEAQQKVLSVSPNIQFPALTLYWSVNNLPAEGDITVGQIGTTSYSSNKSAIYVLGKENVDTDEYDRSVIAHEWGHYFQAAFSRDDSPGGSHTLGDKLDTRTAFSEGWGNAWSGMLFNTPNYFDSYGTAQGFTTTLSLNQSATAVSGASVGWFSEHSVQYVLWQLHQQLGFAPLFNTLTNSSFTQSPAFTSIHSFAANFKALSPNNAATLNSLLASEGISTSADAYGSGETNNGGIASVLPIYKTLIALGTPVSNVCLKTSSGSSLQISDTAFVRFTVATSKPYTFTVTTSSYTGSQAPDPDFVIYKVGQSVQRFESSSSSVSEGGSVTLNSGDYVLELYDFNASTSSCYSVNIQ